MRTVLVLGYNRADCLAQCLRALSRCRWIDQYVVAVSLDDAKNQEEVAKVASKWVASHNATRPIHPAYYAPSPKKSGVDRHNQYSLDLVFQESDFVVVVEDDCLLTSDALELADWYAINLDREQYVLGSLGDPSYRKVWPEDVEASYRALYNSEGLYTSGWCLTKGAWAKIAPHWNQRLKTQLGWDYSLGFTMWEQGWKMLHPEIGRAQNIGRTGVHAYPEWFDANVAGAICSDGRRVNDFVLVHNIVPPIPEWIRGELEEPTYRYPPP